jgi:two-component system cell cycle response regulator
MTICRISGLHTILRAGFTGERKASMNDPDIQKMNDELARKFGKIEAELVVCRGIGELFERLLSESEEAFGIPFVWLSILHDPKTETLLRVLNDSELLRNRLNVIEPSSFLEVCPDGPSSVIASGDLRPFFRLMPPNVKYFIRSLAVAPLAHHGHLIGSLNHGDASPERYKPGMGTTLLDHLAATVSGRLSDLLPPAENGVAGPGEKGEA